jgi:type I restriction enzyme S subunit
LLNKIVAHGSVVFSSRAPIGHIAFANNELCTNQGFKSVIPYILAVNEWIFYALMNMTRSIISRASGTTFLEVSVEFMRKEIIALPPLAEQQRIVAKVEELIAMCEELKSAHTLPVLRNVTEVSNIIPFPQKSHLKPVVDRSTPIDLAARGDADEGLVGQAVLDANELLGDD